MWGLIILLIVVLYFIGKHENAKKNNAKSTQNRTQTQAQAQTQATQKTQYSAYDAETKQLYDYMYSELEHFLKHELRGVPSKKRKELKEEVELEIKMTKVAQMRDTDGTKVRNSMGTFKRYMQNLRACTSSPEESPLTKKRRKLSRRYSSTSYTPPSYTPPSYTPPSHTPHTQPSYSQPTYSSTDYYEEERQRREARASQIYSTEKEIDALRRKGAVIEADELKKKLDDFKMNDFRDLY